MTKNKDPKPVVLFPAEVLRAKCDPLDGVSDVSKDLAGDLRATLSTSTGIGLAAPQIGIAKRMILLRCDPKTRAGGGLIMIDPVIVETSEVRSLMMEGCLSLPGERFPVVRPDKVMVEYLSETGRIKTIELEGLAAKCVQHEIDHLDGILIMDRSAQMAAPALPRIGEIEAATFSHLSRSR
ncbi:peptide deformylase [Agrobacterium salinitolerans]|nr:peptide deformylase [Agrobacterium salinitolerans]